MWSILPDDKERRNRKRSSVQEHEDSSQLCKSRGAVRESGHISMARGHDSSGVTYVYHEFRGRAICPVLTGHHLRCNGTVYQLAQGHAIFRP